MDRCALFVDASYVLADGAQAVHGTRHRDSVTWDYPGLLKLLTEMAQDRAGLPVLRCYWYDAAAGGRRASGQDELADLPGVKLRLDTQQPGGDRGETGIGRDLTTLARNRAVSDVVLVTADESLSGAIAEAQDSGIRVAVMHITTGSSEPVGRVLRQECDEVIEITAADLRPLAELVPGAEPASRADEPAENIYQGGELASGHNARMAALAQPAGTAGGMTSSSPAYAGPPAEYQRAEPMLTGVAPGSGHGSPQDRAGSTGAAGGQDSPGVPPQGQGSYGAKGYPGNGYSANGLAQDSGSAPWPGGPAGGGVPPAQDQRAPAANGLPSSGLPASGLPAPGRGAAPGASSTPQNGLPPQAQAGYQQNGLTRPDHGGLPENGLSAQPPSGYQQNGLPAGPSRAGPQPVREARGLAPDGQLGGSPARRQPPGDSRLPYPAPPLRPSQVPPGGGRAQPGSSIPAQASGPYDSPPPPMPPRFSAPAADSVQAAHAEGFGFGEAVAREAPALWLEAVLARKPRMPSDLEARLLQGSALPVDSLLQDELRHALRRGFWDALERSRR